MSLLITFITNTDFYNLWFRKSIVRFKGRGSNNSIFHSSIDSISDNAINFCCWCINYKIGFCKWISIIFSRYSVKWKGVFGYYQSVTYLHSYCHRNNLSKISKIIVRLGRIFKGSVLSVCSLYVKYDYKCYTSYLDIIFQVWREVKFINISIVLFGNVSMWKATIKMLFQLKI